MMPIRTFAGLARHGANLSLRGSRWGETPIRPGARPRPYRTRCANPTRAGTAPRNKGWGGSAMASERRFNPSFRVWLVWWASSRGHFAAVSSLLLGFAHDWLYVGEPGSRCCLWYGFALVSIYLSQRGNVRPQRPTSQGRKKTNPLRQANNAMLDPNT